MNNKKMPNSRPSKQHTAQKNIKIDKTAQLIAEEAQLKVDKLREEIKFVKYQTSKRYKRLEFFKALSGIASILAALFTLATILFSVKKWSDDQTVARQAKEGELFTSLLSQLQNPSPQIRLNAATSLTPFFNGQNNVRKKQLIFSLTNTIAFEEDKVARTGYIEILKTLSFNKIDSTILQEGLSSLISLDKSIKSNYTTFSRTTKDSMALEKFKGLSEAISVFFTKGVKTNKLENLVFVNTNFNAIKFVEYTSFANTDFIDVGFSNDTCQSCDFSGCNSANLSIYNCKLPGSRFATNILFADFLSAYLKNQHIYQAVSFIDCNLSGSTFNNIPIFTIIRGSDYSIRPVKFNRCIVDSVSIANFLTFTIKATIDKSAIVTPKPLHPEDKNFDSSINQVFHSETDWHRAKLSDGIRTAIKLTNDPFADR